MACSNDRDLALHLHQNELAASAFAAAGRSFTNSIRGNPDAELALRLQKMEVMTPVPPEDSERFAWQIYEEEQFEQEQQDADVAHTLESEERRQHGQPRSRVPNLNAAMRGVNRTNQRRRNGNMNFSRSVRGPSMIGPIDSPPSLDVFGPGVLVDQDDIDIDGEHSILPRPRPRPAFARNSGIPHIDLDDSPPVGPDIDDMLPLPGQFRRINERPRFQPGAGERRRHHNPAVIGRNRGLAHALRRNLHDPHGNHWNYMYHGNDEDLDLDDYEALWDLQERNVDVRSKGLSQDQIQRIPHHKFKSKPGLNKTLKSDKNSCSICLNEYKDGENIKTLPCFHSYHKSCIDKWIKGQAVCPVCRRNIKPS